MIVADYDDCSDFNDGVDDDVDDDNGDDDDDDDDDDNDDDDDDDDNDDDDDSSNNDNSFSNSPIHSSLLNLPVIYLSTYLSIYTLISLTLGFIRSHSFICPCGYWCSCGGMETIRSMCKYDNWDDNSG